MNLRLIFISLVVCLLGWDSLRSAPLYYDLTQYAPIQITWRQASGIKEVENVFPHPLLPGRALLIAGGGLWATEDAGQTWAPVPGINVEKLGRIQTVAFHPSNTETYYLGTQSRGVWGTEDGGKSFRQIGSAASGMASDAVADLIVYPADTSFRTLVAVHGTAAPGFSKSVDGGKTWEVLNTVYSFRRIASKSGSPELILYGASKDDTDVWNLYSCATPAEYAVEIVHDVALSDLTFVPSGSQNLLYAASERGLFRIEGEHLVKELGDKDTNWASIAWAWGSSADIANLFLYSPQQQGLAIADRDLSEIKSLRGVPANSLVKEGAVVRVNANGTAFYAAINNALSVGRVDDRVPVISVAPTVFESVGNETREREDVVSALRDFNLAAKANAAAAAKGLSERVGDLGALYRRYQLTINARVPIQPVAPVSVTMDLSRYGGSPETPLYDDGLHGDGAAGDGVYGLQFYFQPSRLYHEKNDWRPSFPGPVALGVRASYPDGQNQGAVGIVGVYPRPASFYFWGDWFRSDDVVKWVPGSLKKEGDLALQALKNPDQFKPKRSVCSLRVEAPQGPWSLQIPVPSMKTDFSSHEGVSFWIKMDQAGPAPKLFLQLRDIPELAAQVTTERVEVRASREYQKVFLPFSVLLGKNDPPLQISRVGKLILSSDGEAPAAFTINDLQIVAPGDERSASNLPPSP